MPDLGPHANFILAAYGFTFAAVADDRKQRQRLAALEAKGIKRRSAGTAREGKPPRGRKS
jgi:heme exporter protein D